MCILLVEDEPLIRLIMAEELAEAGFEVREAETGDQAAALIEATPSYFTLLVTDIHMPGTLDGIELARLMRTQRPDIPIIYTTGRPGALNDGVRLGARDILVVKPFTPSHLLAVVHRLLGAGGNRAR
jgi:DNA-binding response OmpR family regulator